MTRVSNGRVLHLTTTAPQRDVAWEPSPTLDEAAESDDALDIPLGFRPVLLTREHEESALQIAAFVGRVLAERRRPDPA